ncbi:hypothetical protein CPB86DRAFT_786862 [Serendipita vermifera]|nr:hypothetical protein CPB86DRAFT_786862 [Serendipita vermifera]
MSQPGVGSAEFVDAETIFQTFERAEKTAKIELYFPVEQRPEVDGKMYKCRLRFKVPESGPICWGAEQAPCNRKFRSMDIWRRHVIEGHLGCRREKAQEGNDLAQGSDPTREKGKDLRRKEVFQRRRARVGPSGSQPLDARRRRAGHDTEQGLDTNVKFHPYKRHSRSG